MHLEIELPEGTFAVGIVSLAVCDDGNPFKIITATEYPIEDLESLGRAGLPTAMRRVAEELAEQAPKYATIPTTSEEDD